MILDAFAARFSGKWRADVIRADLFERLAARAEAGRFLPLAAGARNRYAVVAREPAGLQLRAANLRTAINVGLNEIVLERTGDGAAVAYRVAYPRWAQYCNALCLLIALPVALALQVPSLRELAGAPPAAAQLGLALGFFWGVIWPAILTVMHRKPAATLLERLLDEVNAEGADA